MIAFETVPTTLDELTEWTDHTGSPDDTVEHIAAGAVEETLEACAAGLDLLRFCADAKAKDAGRVKRQHRGDVGYEVLKLEGMNAVAAQSLINRFMHEDGDRFWYVCRARRRGFYGEFDDAVNDVADQLGMSSYDYRDAENIVNKAAFLARHLLGIGHGTYQKLVLSRLHERLTRRKLAGTIKGEGDR